MNNPYMPMMPQTDYGANPWAIDNTSSQVQAGAQNLQAMGAGASDYSAQSSPYPSFPNSMGLGSQSAFSPTPQQNSSSLQINSMNASASPANAQFDPGSRGFNPWSLRGEALSR